MFRTDGQYRLQGWVVSGLFHSLALTVALGLMAQVKPVVPKEVFTWDVALVEPQLIQETRQADNKPTLEPTQSAPRPAVPAPSQPQTVTQDVQPREVTSVVPREIRQAVETSQPIQSTEAVQTRTEAVTQVREQQPAEVQQAKQAVVESAAPAVRHEAVTQPVTTEAPIHPVGTRTVETASVTRDSDQPPASAPAAAAASDAKPAEFVAQESASQVAMATRPNPAVKADYGWLAESLRRRLAEIKRYPSAARLNGWEGKVVLRAVIRADGHLSEVKVHRSSGHEVLDNAAMEAIRLVCPLHMANAMGAAEVAVYVPIVYSLGG
ncbi:MAG: TonB family protein [Nitrospirae bacterium]|nr:TonB family protein [Nitrospirota bacterium]